METKENYVLEAFIRSQGFLDTNAGVLGSVNTTGARADLNTAVTTLSGHGAQQTTSRLQAKGETTNQRTLRSALIRAHMRPIAMIAIAKLGDVPQFSSLELPRRHLGITALVQAAESMATVAGEYATTFTAQGLPEDFVQQLNTAASTLQASIANRSTYHRQVVGATQGVASTIADGRKALKVLDSMVRPLLANNADLLAQWKTAKRVVKKPGVSSRATTPAATPPTGGSTPAPSAPAGAATPATAGAGATQTIEKPATNSSGSPVVPAAVSPSAGSTVPILAVSASTPEVKAA